VQSRLARGKEQAIQRLDSAPRTGTHPVGALPACVAFIDALRDTSVSFCAWKSNEHLAAALAGQTDLDLLVDDTHACAFRVVAGRFGMKVLTPPKEGRFPATEHYLGLDEETGHFFHVHVQYRLVLGERFAKNYALPLEGEVLGAVTELDGVPVPRPDVELMILATRALLKYRARDAVKDAIGIRSPGVPDETIAEIAWLLRRTSIKAVHDYLCREGSVIPPAPIQGFLDAITHQRRPAVAIVRHRRALRRALLPYRRRSYGAARLVYSRGMWMRRRKLRLRPADDRMVPVTGGASVAFVGPDGSGKSTMTEAVADWLGWKLRTRVCYLGSKAPSRRSRALYVGFRALRRTHRASHARLPNHTALTEPVATARDAVRALHCLSIGRDRRRRYQRAAREERAGSIVIFDRFPLLELAQCDDRRLFDGPQIPSILPAAKTRITRHLAEAEARQYAAFHLPRNLVVLRVESDVAIARKPDHHRDELRAKCRVIAALGDHAAGTSGVAVTRIDASRPSSTVLAEIKPVIWDVI
jgi:thymidylate kinase